MKISTRNLLNGIVLITLVYNGLAQTPHPLSFYPPQVGNAWQYRSQFTGEIIFTERILRDSVTQNGSIFLWIFTTPANDTSIYEIDSTSSFWSVSVAPFFRSDCIYKLAADSGDVWRINPQRFDSARVLGVRSGIVFGQTTIVKKIEYRSRSFWYGTRYLASDFGLVRWEIEPSDIWYLAGAIINGVQWGTIVSVAESESVPSSLVLHQNFPNPFNPSTTISYELPKQGHVRLNIFDLLGREVAALVNGIQSTGKHSILFNASSLSSGVYLYRLETGGSTITQKLVFQK